jgi:AcrR family transcriptional regulator
MAMLTKSETTISNILAAAHTLFVARNYADVTMAQIAAAGQVTKGALYHHFESKEELYLALLHAELARKQAIFRQCVESPGSCRERLRRLTDTFLQLPAEKRALLGLIRRDINIFRDRARDELIRAYQAALPEQVERILADGIRDGELREVDTRLLSWQFVGLVEVVLSPYGDAVFGDTDAKLDQVLDLFLGGAGRSSAVEGTHDHRPPPE